MPFTFSHPAAAVPFTRWGFPLSALVIGSMSPDFAYFLTQSTTAKFGHTLPGVILFCIPVGFVVLWTFHAIVKRPSLDLLPRQIRRPFVAAVMPFEFWSRRRLGIILLALLIGALTHIVWDAFTGSDRFGTTMIPWLSEPIINVMGDELPAYRVLHILSSIAGGLLLLIWSTRWLERYSMHNVRSIVRPVGRLILLTVIIGITATAFWFMGSIEGNSLFGRHWEVRGFLQSGLIAAVPVLYILLFLYGCGWHLYSRRLIETGEESTDQDLQRQLES